MIGTDARPPVTELEAEDVTLAEESAQLRGQLESLSAQRTALFDAARVGGRRKVDPGVVVDANLDHAAVARIDVEQFAVNRRLRDVNQRRAEIAGQLRSARQLEEARAAAVDEGDLAARHVLATSRVTELEARITALPERRRNAVMSADPKQLALIERDKTQLPVDLTIARKTQLELALQLATLRHAVGVVEMDQQSQESNRLDVEARRAAEVAQLQRGRTQRAAQIQAHLLTRVAAARRALDEHIG